MQDSYHKPYNSCRTSGYPGPAPSGHESASNGAAGCSGEDSAGALLPIL